MLRRRNLNMMLLFGYAFAEAGRIFCLRANHHTFPWCLCVFG
jgi:hypothetical protein